VGLPTAPSVPVSANRRHALFSCGALEPDWH
jgi:hypothetical protein